jgi:hypothetical protein
MSTSVHPLLRAGLLLLSVLWGPAALAQTVAGFTASYKGGSSTCTSTYAIQGKEPTTAGRYPVFIYLVGTSESYTHASALAAVDEMAAAGYVAATVQYPNSSFGGCSTLSGRSKCLFDAATATSAVNTLCSRPNADCSRGVVVAGFSQGSILSILARNFEPRVRAAYALGAGVQYSFYDLRSCVANGRRALPSSLLRAVNGEADGFMGGSASGVRSQLQELTGASCGTSATSCLSSGGSGWYLVRHAEVDDGTADHCYMRQGGCSGSRLDLKWRSGSYAYSLVPGLRWLQGFTTR